MKQYESYKDSGIEWLGKIPSHWTPISMKFYFYMKGRIGWQGLKADEFIEEGPYLVTGTDFENGKVMWERCYHISEERYSEAPEIHVEKGDLLITKDGTVGKLALIDEKPEKVSLNSHLLILRPVKPNIDNHFIYWALQADNFVYYTGLAQNGSIMTSLSQEKIGDYKIALPSFEEQQAIASYLNHKVGQIDSAIAEKEQMLEDLKAYRSAIISEAVTKGLNKNVEMKDSGIEWWGEVPFHWDLLKAKHMFSLVTDSVSDSSLPKVALENIESGSGRYIQTEADFMGEGIEFEPDDILFGKLRPYLAKVYKTEFRGQSVGDIYVFRGNDKQESGFLKYLLLSYPFISVVDGSTYGAKMPRANWDFISQMILPCPPKSEQEEIASFLDHKVNSIDMSTKDIQSQIDDLKAYKSSIITEAVTGKVDLRGWNSNNDKT